MLKFHKEGAGEGNDNFVLWSCAKLWKHSWGSIIRGTAS